jgi:iron complex transport system substrate-binding protein
MRIVSLLPAATEIVGILGQLNDLVGVSHDCDYPPDVSTKPRVTRCVIDGAGLSSAAIDRQVRERIASTGTLYTLDEPLLRRLEPDVILTQRLCDVCAVGFGSVAALASTLPAPPQVLNLEPSCLADIFKNIRSVARTLGSPDRGDAALALLSQRVEAVKAATAQVTHRPNCLLLEWIDPLFSSGHWGPELVELAGGRDPLNIKGQRSARIRWDDVLDVQPQVIVLACCGHRPERTLDDLSILRQYTGWESLSAVRDGRVYVVNGSAHFNRPGPRIVDSLEILAEIIHPDLFAGRFPDRGILCVANEPDRSRTVSAAQSSPA